MSFLRIIQEIADKKILEEMDHGGFDDLPGSGEPLKLGDDSMIPEDIRMAYKVLKNAGYLPEEIQQEKEVRNMIDLIEHLGDEQEKYRQIRKLNVLVDRFNLRRKRPIDLNDDEYYRKVVSRLSVHMPEGKDR